MTQADTQTFTSCPQCQYPEVEGEIVWEDDSNGRSIGRLLGTAFIWGLAINALARWAGDYCWWWCALTTEALTNLSFWSAVASLVVLLLSIYVVDGVAWLVRRWTR